MPDSEDKQASLGMPGLLYLGCHLNHLEEWLLDETRRQLDLSLMLSVG